ncbi:hypothetical protein BT96DRAFT_950304 [Gymnopus androsaceus JB14]|uniref:Uncharacterized protein n=1 Tax=Gymnopus androsaceus JB14 TaxID=1447944 RepID=A0A6A4GH07_9AGAR|nr:hypothetical protein BT96DRAFT_950304 [Gymnopus androsaceus JB14]
MTPKKRKAYLGDGNKENVLLDIKQQEDSLVDDSEIIQSSQVEEISIEDDPWCQSRATAIASAKESKEVDSETESEPESNEDITLVDFTLPNSDSGSQDKPEEPLCWGCAKPVFMWDDELKRPVSIAALHQLEDEVSSERWKQYKVEEELDLEQQEKDRIISEIMAIVS